MKQTPLTDIHILLGAKMHEFAGYSMPIEYSGIIDEHMAVCKNAGLFDISHMGEFLIKGDNAVDFLQKITTNDLHSLKTGQAQYSCITNRDGGIIDDVVIYRLSETAFMMVVNASNIQKDLDWLNDNILYGTKIEDISGYTGLLAIQGPKAKTILQKLTDIVLNEIPYYRFTTGKVAGADNILISNTGYTGAGGFELYFSKENAVHLWSEIINAGKPYGIKPAGLGARDTLRTEMGYCLYGNEINENTTPLEAGLSWITKFIPGNDFYGRDILEKQKENGITRKLCGFRLNEKGIPRNGYNIVDNENKIIGKVTSGTISPTLKAGIGLGYIQKEYAVNGSGIWIQIRNKNIEAVIIKPPFRKTDNK